MANSSRRDALTLGLVASGLVGWVGRVFGQGPREAAEGARATSGTASAMKVGLVDMEAIYRHYEKARAQSEAFKAEVLEAKNELARRQESARREARALRALAPGTADFAEGQAKLGKLLERATEQLGKSSEAAFAGREAEMVAHRDEEIRRAVRAVAEHRGLSLVLRHAAGPKGTDLDPVTAAIAQPVVYADPGSDITSEVIARLNRGE